MQHHACHLHAVLVVLVFSISIGRWLACGWRLRGCQVQIVLRCILQHPPAQACSAL